MIFFSLFCRSGFLEFEVGSVITILDKTSDLWSGVRDETGHVGLFMPSQTVTYLGTIPKNSVSTPNNSGNSSNNFGNIFIFGCFSTLKYTYKECWLYQLDSNAKIKRFGVVRQNVLRVSALFTEKYVTEEKFSLIL